MAEIGLQFPDKPSSTVGEADPSGAWDGGSSDTLRLIGEADC